MARTPTRTNDDDDPMRGAMMALEQERVGAPVAQVLNERTVFGDIVTAQPIKVPRNMPNVLREIDVTAAASEGWYYRFPVKKKGGGVDYIEGPTIDCADAVARIFGNCQVQTVMAHESADDWIFAARFIDLQTGYTLIRPFLQSKMASKLGGDDVARARSIAFSIGTSKAQRNVVDHALRDFVERAFKAAKGSLVARIGAKLPESRAKILDKLKALGGDELIARVVQVYQRKPDAWLAPDIARLVAESKAVEDGMALIEDVWPLQAAEPRRSDTVTDVVDTSAAAGDEAGTHGGTAAQQPASPDSGPQSAPPTSSTTEGAP